MNYGFIKTEAVSPDLRVADCRYNTEKIIEALQAAGAHGSQLVVFPELAVTGYTCGDLFLQTSLQRAAEESLLEIAGATINLNLAAVVGVPLSIEGKLYNCAAVVSGGEVLGIVPKTHLPSHGEFYETRWFTPAPEETIFISLNDLDYEIPFGTDMLFRCSDMPGFILAAEVGADLWAPLSPSTFHALAGATVIACPAACGESAGSSAYRRQLVSIQSAKSFSAYVFASAGPGESSTDGTFGGHDMIAENGSMAAESVPFAGEVCCAAIDVEKLLSERSKNSLFRPLPGAEDDYLDVFFDLEPVETELSGSWNADPFMPLEGTARAQRCEEILNIQAAGLVKRMQHTHAKTAVIGVSGGLDSTLALLVAVEAMIRLQKPVSDVHGITMPCFGTTDATASNAHKLMKLLGITAKEIDIRDAVSQHFRDIGQDPDTHDTTYENAQARERTQVLMDYAGRIGGIVVGTGDLSELALGWCTYNGDHMSMYAVNSSVPKTAIPMIIEAVAQKETYSCAKAVLADIIATPISPELLPPSTDGTIAQRTEDLVGPYILHDFFSYYTVRYGYSPKKIVALANRAFVGKFDAAVIKKWLQTFYRRFFTQQFKRNCQPDGIRTGMISFSPRSDWHIPSDASASLWLQEAEDLQ